MKHFFFLPVFLMSIFLTAAQTTPPKHEFRAVWVATVANIDWPSKPGLSTKQQQNEIIEILDMHQKLGMNAVILQVRPCADALYQSELEPWSRYLSGTPGKPPNPFYDPLAFWIKESHLRGMELHAWLNPYRVSIDAEEPLAGNHIAFQHPNWILKYGERLYFDPGIPEARDFFIEVAVDIVKRYDVDAIHFDDYFYPYPLEEEFPDTTSFTLNNHGYSTENKADWRRDNVNTTIRLLSEAIKSTKPWVKFGISPFGVWRNIEDDPIGSETKAGATNYDHLYADVIKWQKEGWIDYLLPQLYWQIGHPLVDFDLLVKWWKGHSYGRAMYVGQAPYRISPESTTIEWTEPNQIPKQIEILRRFPEIGGSAYFSSKHFKRDLLGFQDSLSMNIYRKPAIVPTMPWIDNTPPEPVTKIKKCWKKAKWQTVETENEMDKPRQFLVYLNEVGTEFNKNNSENIYQICTAKRIKFPRINKKKKKYEVRVSVLDRLNNESSASNPVIIKL